MSELAFYNSTMSGLNGLGRVKGDIRDELVRNKPFVMAPVGDPRFPIGDPIVLEKIKANVLAKLTERLGLVESFPADNDVIKIFKNNPSWGFDLGNGYSVDNKTLEDYAKIIRDAKSRYVDPEDVDTMQMFENKRSELHDLLVKQALNSKYGDNIPRGNVQEINALRKKIGDVTKEILGLD
jgi:hypothetical protein